MNNKKNNEHSKDCEWDCKLGLSLMVIFPLFFSYIYTRYSKFYQMVKKNKHKINANYFGYYIYFRYIFGGLVMLGIILAASVVYILKLYF